MQILVVGQMITFKHQPRISLYWTFFNRVYVTLLNYNKQYRDKSLIGCSEEVISNFYHDCLCCDAFQSLTQSFQIDYDPEESHVVKLLLSLGSLGYLGGILVDS